MLNTLRIMFSDGFMTIANAAHIFSFLTAVVFFFQLALAAGMPWGKLTMGGNFPGRLPPKMRVVAVFSALLLIAFAVTIEIRAGTFLAQWQPLSQKMVWIVVAYCALGVVANAFTPSRWERMLWLPVVIAMLMCSAYVALN
jgi:hypothetical protein